MRVRNRSHSERITMDAQILSLLDQNHIQYTVQAPMSSYTTFRTGGPADIMLFPVDEAQIAFCIGLFADQYVILGNCSNMLISDHGVEGAVILLGKNFSDITVDGNFVTAQAGAKLSALCNTALDAGLVGLEFAAGIPGSVGGGIYMNAGAYGGELSQYLHSVRVMDSTGNVSELSADQLQLGYRKSIFMEQDLIILSGTFMLEHGDVDAARQKVRELNAARRQKQPLEYPSAGSTFKRPVGYYAGALIEQSNLKGVTIGGAQVSEKHAGFIINIGGATTHDILALISHVQAVVKQNFGVDMEPEVRFLGRA